MKYEQSKTSDKTEVRELGKYKLSVGKGIIKIAKDLEQGTITEKEARTLLLGLLGVSKRFYWLKPDGSISNMWNEEAHLKYLTDKDIDRANKDGWQCIQINVC